MGTHHLSMTALSIALAVGALVCFGAFQLYAAWIDGKRQNIREHGGHPTTKPDGDVVDEDKDDD